MARYIDAEEITRRILYFYHHTNNGSGEHYAYAKALSQIDHTPTADVVEVVRCKDCRFVNLMSDGKTLACIRQTAYKKPTDFCSYGGRKDA